MKFAISSMLSRIGAIGYHPDDNEEVKMQKTLLVATAGTMGPMGFLWGGIYLYFNEPLAASIPLSYGVASLVSLAIFSQVKSYRIFRFSQLSFILLLPFLLMLALGGYVNSSAVVVWSFASPLGALVFMERTKALYWFAAYLGLVLAGVYFERYFPSTNNLSEEAIIGFFVMNISGMSMVVFLLVYYFVGEKNLVLRLLEDKHRWIKEAFSAYVSPNLVEHLLRHPEELKLGGERRECTFVFTDLAGFTPLVEESDPSTIVSLLNEYIEEMTKIVFRYEGTIDKIVGDGIAVLFSAPVYQEDHAERGVRCALEMDRFTETFSKKKQQEGIALGQTRIGVNTGTVIIGNVGSMSQFNYSAIGDAVNTTSRLEGANKYLGTRICISRSTVEKCPDILCRPIGSLLLQGKTQAVEAFEPIDPDEANSDRINDYLAAFRLLEKNDAEALDAFAKLQNSYADDALVTFHLKRLRSGITGSKIVLEGK